MTPLVRSATPEDAEAIGALIVALGYEAATAEVAARLEAIEKFRAVGARGGDRR